eukprot:scaffold11286_cov22-Tisochrysis_lutea.AAC.2
MKPSLKQTCKGQKVLEGKQQASEPSFMLCIRPLLIPSDRVFKHVELFAVRAAHHGSTSNCFHCSPAGGLAFSTIELSKGEQEALRAAALSRK